VLDGATGHSVPTHGNRFLSAASAAIVLNEVRGVR
jgi:hypothetical protein